MPQKGDILIIDNTSFVYDGYGVWKKDATRTQIISKEGISASVVANSENSQNELQTRSILSARTPADEFVDIEATRNENLRVSVDEIGDTPNIDAFGKFRVSHPHTLFDSKQLHDKQPLFWDETTGGSASSTHSPVNAVTNMTVTALAGDYVIRQTKSSYNYQPGKSISVIMTFYCPQVNGVTSRIGAFTGTGVNYLTPDNGIFFSIGDTLSWNIAKNGTTTETVTQDNWNVDKLDGTGRSGITLDLNTTQILIFDYEWLGTGRVRVGFEIAGRVYYCHYFNHANTSGFSSVYMSTPNLRLRYDIQTDGTNGATLAHICSSVISEGGLEEAGVIRSVNTGTTHIDASVADTTYALLGLRLKSTYKDIVVITKQQSVMDEQGNAFQWSLRFNPTVAGVFTYSDLDNSAVQRAVGATANTVTGGIIIDSGYVASAGAGAGVETSRSIDTSLRLGSTIEDVFDELVLCVTPLGSNADIQASLTFRELL